VGSQLFVPSTTPEALITLGFALEEDVSPTRSRSERAAKNSPSADSSRAAVLHDLEDFDAAVTAYNVRSSAATRMPRPTSDICTPHRGGRRARRAALEDGNHEVLLNYGNLLADIPGRGRNDRSHRHAVAVGERDAS
jgi:hypothetical protein